MKKNYLITLILSICFSFVSFGQGSEKFTGVTLPTAYSDDSFVGAGGITWTYVHSRDANGDANNSGIDMPALMLRRSSNESKITSSTISGGIGDFSVKLYKGFTGGGNRQVELFINGVSKGTSVGFDDYNEHVFSVSGINITGDIIIEIKNITGKQVIIDDITWTEPSSEPTLSITFPNDNQVFQADTKDITVTLGISNFNLSGDNGSEMTDNTGDGYILGTLIKDGNPDGTKNIFTNSAVIDGVDPGSSYTVKAELVDNSGASLSPKVESIVNFSVDYPCDIQLGTYTKACNTSGGSNTYEISIPFTAGNTSTYTLTSDFGTIGGDDPSTNESGTITISNIAEGQDVAFNLKGDVNNSNCDISRNIKSPICVSLPIVEAFDYTADANLVSNSLWIDIPTSNTTKNDIQVKSNLVGGNPVLGSYYGANDLPAFTGNMVTLNGGGSDAYLGFEDKTSGTVYASFTFHVTDMSSFSNTNGGYFAVLADSNSGFRSRLWIKDPVAGEGLTFNMGISTGNTASMHNGFTANLAEPVFIVMSYNLDNDEVQLWVVPDASTFGSNSAPTANVTVSGGTADAINRFILRQDSSSETPIMDIDELRIGTSWKEVTSNATASISKNNIEGFTTYPNPVTNGKLTVSSNSADSKQITIFNILGKKVFSTSFSSLKKEINVTSLNAGVYILKVIENNNSATKKLVIK